jgi:hypothetical protein
MTAQSHNPDGPERVSPMRDGSDPDRRTPDPELLARGLPGREAPETLWPRIEHSLREAQRHEAESPAGLLELIARLFQLRAVSFALYAVILLVGAGMGWYLLRDYAQRGEAVAGNESSEEMMRDARSDIEQAMFYYERAIAKLTVLAERNEEHLDPQFVALQKEKIALLHASIEECKTALEKNSTHPEVQHYLLLAYNDLQNTLQLMVNQAN